MNRDNSLVPVESELLIVELDDRLEFSVMQPMDTGCGINGYCANKACNTGNCVAGCGG